MPSTRCGVADRSAMSRLRIRMVSPLSDPAPRATLNGCLLHRRERCGELRARARSPHPSAPSAPAWSAAPSLPRLRAARPRLAERSSWVALEGEEFEGIASSAEHVRVAARALVPRLLPSSSASSSSPCPPRPPGG